MAEITTKIGIFTKYSGWLLGVVGGFMVIAMLAFGLYMLSQADFKDDSQFGNINKIELKADFRRAKISDIQDFLKTLLNQAFIDLDLAWVERKLNSHPWVRQAVLKKKWPDTLIVHLEEQVPVAILNTGGYLNSRAEVFDEDTTINFTDLPLIESNSKDYKEILKTYVAVKRALGANNKVTSIRYSQMGAYVFKLINGTELILGRRRLDRKIKRLKDIFDYLQNNQVNTISRIDLRYRSAVALKLESQENS